MCLSATLPLAKNKNKHFKLFFYKIYKPRCTPSAIAENVRMITTAAKPPHSSVLRRDKAIFEKLTQIRNDTPRPGQDQFFMQQRIQLDGF
jgi:hypothetical protein